MALVYLITYLHGGDVNPRCDIIEINHYVNDQTGEVNFTQVLAWDWAYDYHRRQCEGWKLVHRWHRTKTGIVGADERGNEFTLDAPSFMETWTNYDPELVDRKRHPDKHRRKVW